MSNSIMRFATATVAILVLAGVAQLDRSAARAGASPSLPMGICTEDRARSGDDLVMQACKDAVMANPKDAMANANLCAALSDDMLGAEQLKSALRYCDDAIRLKPALILAHKNRADVLARLGRHSEALAEISEVIRLARAECPKPKQP